MGAITQDRVSRTLALFEREVETLDEMAQRMGGVLTDGEGSPVYQGLPEICREWDVAYGRVLSWLMADAERYAVYQRCLEAQAHMLVAETTSISDGAPVAVFDAAGKPVLDKDGNQLVTRNETARDKLRVETRFRVAKHHAPKVYGEKVDVNHTVTPVFMVTINNGAPAAVPQAEIIDGSVL